MTIVLHSKTKASQRITVSDSFKTDEKGKKLTFYQMLEKAKEVGHDVLKNDLKSVFLID